MRKPGADSTRPCLTLQKKNDLERTNSDTSLNSTDEDDDFQYNESKNCA